MKKVSKKAVKAAVSAAEPKPMKAESRAVLAIRIPMQDRDRVRKVAGWGRQQEWIYNTLMKAVEAAEKK